MVLNAGLAIAERARVHRQAGKLVVTHIFHSRPFALSLSRAVLVLAVEGRAGFDKSARTVFAMADAGAPFRIKGETGEWEVVVGLEVHAQITATKSKLFSGAATAFGAEPNTQVSLVDAAMPGMLPVPNKECIRQAVRTGMALDAKINRWSRFDRKNYFYADLPQGYQISQLYHPLVGEGEVEILLDEKDESSDQAHRHRAHPRRAGRGQADARPASDDELRRSQPLRRRADGDRVAAGHAFARGSRGLSGKLRAILRYVGSCDGNMEEGSMRADVNVSVRKPGGELGHADRDQERQFGPLRHGGRRA